MKAPHLLTNRRISKPRPIFVEALVMLILLVVGKPLWSWLNLPTYILWVVVAVYAVYVFITIVFARPSSDVKS